MNNYEKLNLYPHNIKTCKKVKEAYDNGESIVSIIKATGTGKSYIGLNLALENKDKKIIWLVPTNAIKEHIIKTINNNPNLNMEEDFPNLEIRTYSSLIYMEDEEIEYLECDLLIVDELHHIGAPVWGEKVNYLINTHEGMKVFGMSAYSVRDRGTSYERDMTNPDTEEIFSNTVVDRYDLYDAIIDGVLPLPITKTVLTENSSLIEFLEEAKKLKKIKGKTIQHEITQFLDTVKKTIYKQNPVKEIIQETIEESGKYIYFCPVHSNSNDINIDIIEKTITGYIKEKYPNKKIITYKTTSNMKDNGKYNRECFYHDIDLEGEDVSNAIRIMFAKNQYNEGVHAPNVDGVFLGRESGSDIVVLEQIGRALSVSKNIEEKRKEYNLLHIDKLKELATSRGIIFEENITKEYLIELLISPRIVDLAGNIEFLEELSTNLKDRARERKEKGNIKNINPRRIEFLEDFPSYEIYSKQKDLIISLLNLKKQIDKNSWDEYYELAKIYYNHYGNSEIPQKFKTINGYEYDENGISLGAWCAKQREKINTLTKEQISKLESIDFRLIKDFALKRWNNIYNLAYNYYKHYRNCEIPSKFKTKNGIDYDKDGVSLGSWCETQRKRVKQLSREQITKLEEIEFRFTSNFGEQRWNKMYKLAKNYYNRYGNSNIPESFKTKNGIDYDQDGFFLGIWCQNQRQCKEQLNEERKRKLEEIEFRFTSNFGEQRWNNMYELAKNYYNRYGNSEIPSKFKTKNGIDYDKDGFSLGAWCRTQRHFNNNLDNLDEERKKKLEEIEFRFTLKKENKKQKELLCQTYEINYKKHKILSSISYQELYAKIMFLIDNNYPLEINDKLHEIFYMSNENMILKYMISKEDLIMKYYIERKGKRV